MSDAPAREAIARQTEQVFRELRQHVSRRRQLAIVKAPPGSGKTYLLVQTVSLAFGDGESVAIGAQTNAQADDICRRLARDHPKIPVYRFAAGSVAGSALGRSVTWIWETRDLPAGAGVVVATTAKWGMIDLATPFDCLFIDEAWQMGWADFMLCGQVAARFVLIGDPGQIPPVVSIPVQRWETSPRAPHQPAPEVILEDSGVSRLRLELPACRRLPADAVDLIRPFYDFPFGAWAQPGERWLNVKPQARRHDGIDAALESLAGGSVAAVTLPTPDEGPPFEQDVEVATLAARTADRLLAREARAVDGEGARAQVLTPEDIGLAATHRVMNAAMEQALPARLRGRVRVDTPERWQGLERKVMIVVHPLSGVIHPSAFDLETGRLCVMASRHRCGLIVVSRDHIRETLEEHIPYAEQAVGRPDVAGRGHAQHLEFWNRLGTAERIFRA